MPAHSIASNVLGHYSKVRPCTRTRTTATARNEPYVAGRQRRPNSRLPAEGSGACDTVLRAPQPCGEPFLLANTRRQELRSGCRSRRSSPNRTVWAALRAPYPGDGRPCVAPGGHPAELGFSVRLRVSARPPGSVGALRGRPPVQHRRGRYKAHCDCHRGDGRGVLAQSGASKGRRRTPTMPGFSTSSTIALPPERLAPSSRTAPCRASRAERARSDAVGDRARLGCTATGRDLAQPRRAAAGRRA